MGTSIFHLPPQGFIISLDPAQVPAFSVVCERAAVDSIVCALDKLWNSIA